jgi:hypothetical protein
MWHAWGGKKYVHNIGRDNLENVDVDGRMILRWIVRKYDGRAFNGLM